MKRPTLDVKTSIMEHERTIDMMCDITNKSPSVFLQAYQPLRIPDQTRKSIEACFAQSKFGQSYACGILVSSLNPIAIYKNSDVMDELGPHDVQLLMN